MVYIMIMLLVGVIAFLYVLIIRMQKRIDFLEMKIELAANALIVHLMKAGELSVDESGEVIYDDSEHTCSKIKSCK